MNEIPTLIATQQELRDVIARAVNDTPITDIHTHVYAPRFGDVLLWGIDELLTYHYLVAEAFRWLDLPYDAFWAMPKRAQADLIWQTLFIEHSPVSEACRGVLTTLQRLGLDAGSRDLNAYRRYFAEMTTDAYIDQVFALAGVSSLVMTNDPFDAVERPVWMTEGERDPRFHAALRIDTLLNAWPMACAQLRAWGYAVEETLAETTLREVRRFLADWIARLQPLYLAASLPPTFAIPEDSPGGRLVCECLLPVCAEQNLPFAMMIGVKKLVNPHLRLAGDAVGKGSINTVEALCATYPRNKFLVTMLARENQHELCVAARKFRNLLPFGCWWFLNTPVLIEEMTRLRLELLGLCMVPQHSDARVFDQLIYKWNHTRTILASVLTDQYASILATGWSVTEEEIRRDVAGLLGGNFWTFLNREGTA